jgi:hypothetical protein
MPMEMRQAIGRDGGATVGSEAEQRGQAWGVALNYMSEHPSEYLRRCLGRFITMWLPWTPVMSPMHRFAKVLLWIAIIPPGFWGMWKARRALATLPLMAPVVGTTLVLTGILLDPALAYRTPAEPFLSVFAACVCVTLWDRSQGLRQGKAAVRAEAQRGRT